MPKTMPLLVWRGSRQRIRRSGRGKVHFVQQYQKNGFFWFPVMTTSVTDARMFGATDVNIRYFDYKPVSAAPTGLPNISSMEANNDRH